MTSIDSKTVGDQYLPSYLSISSWYSPSRCHIQIQSPSAPLKVSASFFLVKISRTDSVNVDWYVQQQCCCFGFKPHFGHFVLKEMFLNIIMILYHQ